MIRAFIRWAERLSVVLALLGAVSLGCVALVTMTDIVLRPFGSGVRGVIDYVQLFVITGIFLGMPYTFFSDGHARVEVVLNLLPTKLRQGILIAVTLIMVVFVAILAWRSMANFLVIQDRGDVTLHLRLPMTLFWGPLVLGFALSVVATLGLLARQCLGIEAGRRDDGVS